MAKVHMKYMTAGLFTVVVWIVAPVVIPIIWSGTNSKLNFWRSTAKATVASSIANWSPTHLRGPPLNGIYLQPPCRIRFQVLVSLDNKTCCLKSIGQSSHYEWQPSDKWLLLNRFNPKNPILSLLFFQHYSVDLMETFFRPNVFTFWPTHALFFISSGDIIFGSSKLLVFHIMIHEIGQIKTMNPWYFRG